MLRADHIVDSIKLLLGRRDNFTDYHFLDVASGARPILSPYFKEKFRYDALEVRSESVAQVYEVFEKK